MQKGSTLFYHNHINKSIDRVQKRTQTYINRRKGFLRRYCEPLQQKIAKLDKQIDFYKHLIKNQNQMIQNQEQVVQLKREISQFLATQKYFLNHLEQYQQRIVELGMENKVLNTKIRAIKQDISGTTRRKAEQVYNDMTQRDNSSLKSGGLNHSKISSQEKLSNNKNQQHSLLPAIFKVEKYFVNKEMEKFKGRVTLNNRKNIDGPFTVDVNCSLDTNKNSRLSSETEKYTNVQTLNHPVINKQQLVQAQVGTVTKMQVQKKTHELKHRFKEVVSDFNKFESLFKECFDKKKNHVQKSVSQLQSKLITNRQRFLDICSAVGDKDLERIDCQAFLNLSGDQIMTLMISFPWIQRKLFKELVERRKHIVQIQTAKFF